MFVSFTYRKNEEEKFQIILSLYTRRHAWKLMSMVSNFQNIVWVLEGNDFRQNSIYFLKTCWVRLNEEQYHICFHDHSQFRYFWTHLLTAMSQWRTQLLTHANDTEVSTAQITKRSSLNKHLNGVSDYPSPPVTASPALSGCSAILVTLGHRRSQSPPRGEMQYFTHRHFTFATLLQML